MAKESSRPDTRWFGTESQTTSFPAASSSSWDAKRPNAQATRGKTGVRPGVRIDRNPTDFNNPISNPLGTDGLDSKKKSTRKIVKGSHIWADYIKILNLDLWDKLVLAQHRRLNKVVLISELRGRLESLESIIKSYPIHDNLLEFSLYIEDKGLETSYIVFDYGGVTLTDIIMSGGTITEEHIGVIMVQTISGLFFLVENGIEHIEIHIDGIMVSAKGDVKIGDPFRGMGEGAKNSERESVGYRTSISLGKICLGLMQDGDIPEGKDGSFRVSEPARWTPELQDFVRNTSHASLKTLKQGAFIRKYQNTPQAVLAGLVEFAQITVHRSWTSVE